MALEARAELLETRGFISITVILPVFGLIANCTLLPPVSTPISRKILKLASRIRWYSLSVSVRAGAIVIESPVCTPIGSKFSMLHTIMQLSLLSRITSISNSFQPSSDSSIKISLIGLVSKPFCASVLNSSILYATPLPPPARVKLARIISGNPISLAASSASSMV